MYAPVVEVPLANFPTNILHDVVVSLTTVATTIDRLFFGLLELVDERINFLDG